MATLPTICPTLPTIQALSLVSALQNPIHHDLHMAAIRARDEALSSSPHSYSALCLQLCHVLVACDNPSYMLQHMNPSELQQWKRLDEQAFSRLNANPSHWVIFGQTAGFILKNALLRPPLLGLTLMPEFASQLKTSLLYAIALQHAELRSVASSIVASLFISADGVQPQLHVHAWPDLVSTLIRNIQQIRQENGHIVAGSMQTILKIMEDGPSELPRSDLDQLIPILISSLSASTMQATLVIPSLKCLASCLSMASVPASLVAHVSDYLRALSTSTSDPSAAVRRWVCRNLVLVLEHRTEWLAAHLSNIGPFILQSTSDDPLTSDLALEACDFWLTFASLEDGVLNGVMHDAVGLLLPSLIPVLLSNMVYTIEKQSVLKASNDASRIGNQDTTESNLKPIFHRSQAVSQRGFDEGNEDSEEEIDDYEDDEDGWTVRKCSAASLDALSNLYGAEVILPILLPCIEEGLTNTLDPWKQEACILALGAVAEGCQDGMRVHLSQIYPYLMAILNSSSVSEHAPPPQVLCIAAWTVGQYASWAVEQVQAAQNGQLLSHLSQILIQRMQDDSPRVQVAACGAFGTLVEAAGDLMAPYLIDIYQFFSAALTHYQSRSLLALFDVLGIMADSCGSAIGEDNLPSMYVPPLLFLWAGRSKQDPRDRTLLPLIESLASITVTCGINFQPYALESFDNAMYIIESVTLQLAAEEEIKNEEELDPIICCADFIDALVEGLGGNFAALLSSSHRYGPQFLNVLLSMCQHEISGVRMSALALLGDLARNAPAVIEPALPQLLQEAIHSMDPIQPVVSINAVWAIGEICLRCQGNRMLLEPYASSVMQNLIGLLMGNNDIDGSGRGNGVPGLSENAAACVGRLSKVDPKFVAPELSRFLLGWCDGMAKIRDPAERRDAFQGFLKAVYANPSAVQQTAENTADTIVSILFAIMTWHMPEVLPEDSASMLSGNYIFLPFPATESDLGTALIQLVQDLKSSIDEREWHTVSQNLPVNVRMLLRETYKL